MQLSQFEIGFLKKMKQILLKEDLPICKVFSAKFHQDYKGSEEDRKRYESYTRNMIFNQSLILTGKLFFSCHNVMDKNIDQEFIDFFKIHIEILGI